MSAVIKHIPGQFFTFKKCGHRVKLPEERGVSNRLAHWSRNARHRFGGYWVCGECHNKRANKYNKENKESRKKVHRVWNINNRERIFDLRLKRRYGISLEEYKQRTKKQNNKCLICNKERKLVVDHIKGTKIVRGLLCSKCNSILGYADENPATLREAASYLEIGGSNG